MTPERETSDRTSGSTPDRRQLLRGLGAVGLASTAFAGCLGLDARSSNTTEDGGTRTDEPSLAPPIQGDPKAAVTVAVYEDFACPHCRTYNLDVLSELESKYIASNEIRYEHHDFPIPVADPESYEAANAARAVQHNAGDGQFWTYARGLFEEQSSLGPDTYASLATEMGLDGERIKSAAVNRTYKSTVMGDRRQGSDRGVGGTPTVFVDGEAVSEPSVSAISSAIESAK